jgi:hypothetical protein
MSIEMFQLGLADASKDGVNEPFRSRFAVN